MHTARRQLFFYFVLLDVVFIEYIAAFGTEFRRMMGIGRLPTAFIAAVQRGSGRFPCAAFRAELTLVYSAAGAGPAFRSRLRSAAFRAEFAAYICAALALPAV